MVQKSGIDHRKGLGTDRRLGGLGLKCKLGENGQLGPPEEIVA